MCVELNKNKRRHYVDLGKLTKVHNWFSSPLSSRSRVDNLHKTTA